MRETWVLLLLVLPLATCLPGCLRGQFACKNGACVSANERCDHETNCSDGSDELDCDYKCKSPHMKPCQAGNCISVHFFCDGQNDCGDWSDELNCTKFSEDSAAPPCPSSSFHCKGEMCIPASWVCDGAKDCQDGLDELHCNITNACKNGHKCGDDCILKQWVCDGEKDCSDGSDEIGCGSDPHIHQCLPEHGWYNCQSKGTLKCMPIQRACDKFADCDDNSDEGGLCGTAKCDNSTCTHGCHITPKGSVCVCPAGLRLNGNKCEDIDECQVDPPLCSQSCINIEGGYRCSCVSGYTLSSDNRTCFANGPEPVLYISTARELRSLTLHTKEYDLVQSGVSQVHGIAVDYDDRFVFWAEKSTESAGIYKSHMGTTGHDMVVSIGIEVAEDLDVDWVGRHIYYVDSGRKHIVVCDMQGLICTVVLSGRLDKPRGIAVYPETRLFFWTDWGSRPHIGSAGMDGSERTDIITTDVAWPNGIAVDDTTHRIFWCDAKLNRIESSKLDGSDRLILQATVSHPYDVDVFENRIYWSDIVDHEVISCNKFTGKNQVVLVKESSLTPTGIHMHHPSKQRQMLNPCWHGVCSHMCLLSPSTMGFQCACPVGQKLNNDNRTCTSEEVQSSIVIATYTDLFQVVHHQIGKDSVIHLPTRNLENIGAMTFNPMGHSVIYTDLNRKIIYSMHLETYRESILFQDVADVEGLDIDPYMENLYWTQVSQGLIVMANVDTGERLVIARGLNKPTCIVLAPERGLMFVVEGHISHVISVWHMDGSWRQELVQVFGMVSSLTYDRQHLYFSDSVRGTIERISIDGSDKTILRSHVGSPMAMHVGSASIYWLTRYSNRINWINKRDLKISRGFAIDAGHNVDVEYRKLAVVEAYDFTAEHSCLGHSGGCSNLCAPVPNGSKCLCPLGMELEANQHSCRLSDCIGDKWFKCQSGCVPAANRCDDVDDCPSGEDEKLCKNETVAEMGCKSTQFQCKSGGCVEAAYVCDGEFDCHDESDEPSTCPPANCLATEFRCANNRSCIPRAARCDGQRDCFDGSDEDGNCTSGLVCSTGQFACKQSGQCIPLVWRCDKDKDCEHGEDETGCNGYTCQPGYVKCPNHKDCIPRITLCNGDEECHHGTDEQLCAHLNDVVVTHPPPSTCSPDKYTCYMGSSECIAASAKCDCKFDCQFGEDEDGCPPCPGEELFRCPGELKYVNTAWICDGLPDCASGADEAAVLCPSTPSWGPSLPDLLCSETEFQCTSGSCVALSSVCDGFRDCTDGTDEGRNCSKSCDNNGNCPHKCIKTPEEPICQCNAGFESGDEGRQCSDVDECLHGNPCSQLCTNTKGSFKCTCAHNYALEHDQRTCKVIGGRPYYIVASQNDVDLISGDDVKHLVHSEGHIKDIAYWAGESRLFWIADKVLYSKNMVDSTFQMVYNLSGATPTGLAHDRVSGNFYVSVVAGTLSRQKSAVKVVSARLSVEKTIIESDGAIFTDIALDSMAGLLFYTVYNKPHSGRIIRSAMDGSSPSWLHSVDKIIHPISLTLDTIKKRIFWADMRLYSIYSCDYDGLDQRQLVSNTYGTPLSVSFFENQLVWSNVDQKEMRTLHLATMKTDSVTYDRISHILTVHSALEPEIGPSAPCALLNQCGNGVCLLKNSTNFTCTCPDGWIVNAFSPFSCSRNPLDPRGDVGPLVPEDPSSPGVTVASILICLAVLTILAILGWLYYRRWHRTIGSPLKFRFRNALGLTEESTGWGEDSVDYSDRKMLYPKEDDGEPHIVVDQNENRTMVGAPLVPPPIPARPAPTDSAYASQQSLVKSSSAGEIQSQPQTQQLLPVSYSMKENLLASEL